MAIEAPDTIVAEWTALAERIDTDPFGRPEWWSAWRSSFADDLLAVATVRDDAGLRALAPVLVDGGRLRLAYNDHVPWAGVLSDDAEATNALVAGLIGTRQPRLAIGPVPLDGPLASSARTAAARARYRTTQHRVRCSVYAEPSGSADITEMLDTSFRRDLRRRRRRLEEQGGVEVTVHRDGPDLAERLDEAFALELRQWKGAEQTAIASRPETRQFYTRVAESAAARGELELSLLRIDGRPLAFTLVLRHGRILYGLKTAYDPEFARFSPGQLLQWEVFADAHRRGIERYEFLGRADPYKLRWTSAGHDLGTVVVYPRTPMGTAAYAARRYARPAAARVRDALLAVHTRARSAVAGGTGPRDVLRRLRVAVCGPARSAGPAARRR